MANSYVLVVEDDPAIRAAIVEILASEGVAARQAGNGREALEALAAHGAAALILLDLMMPEMDGATVLDRQRADTALAKIPVVLMTASHRGDLKHLRAAALLKKP